MPYDSIRRNRRIGRPYSIDEIQHRVELLTRERCAGFVRQLDADREVIDPRIALPERIVSGLPRTARILTTLTTCGTVSALTT